MQHITKHLHLFDNDYAIAVVWPLGNRCHPTPHSQLFPFHVMVTLTVNHNQKAHITMNVHLLVVLKVTDKNKTTNATLHNNEELLAS